MATDLDLWSGWDGKMPRRVEERDLRKCGLFGCFCCWSRHCSDRLRRVDPLREYLSRSARAEPLPVWSVFIGCTSVGGPWHNLRLHRFRVTGTGQVTGHSNDVLERIRCVSPHDVSPLKDKLSVFDDAMAALGPDSKHLYVICVHRPVLSSDVAWGRRATATEEVFPPKVFSMDLGDMSLSPMRPLPFTDGSYGAISAHGGLWVPVVLTQKVEKCPFEFTRRLRLFIYRLVDDDGSWAEVTSADFQYQFSIEYVYGGTLFQGYAVISDRFILLSFINSSFFCLDCATGTLAPVTTAPSPTTLHQFVPISGKGVHFEGAIYFIRGTRLFAYMYSPWRAGHLNLL